MKDLTPKQSYYKKNKIKWKKGGEYYYYKPIQTDGKLIVKRGNFILTFD